MPEGKIIFITSVPEKPGRSGSLATVPDDGTLWGEVSGDLFKAIQTVEYAGLPLGKKIYKAGTDGPDTTDSHPPASRKFFLEQAPKFFDLVELNFGRDTMPDVLHSVPPAARLISIMLEPTTADKLEACFYQMASIQAAYYKIVIRAEKSGDELLPLSLLKKLGRTDVIAYASGPLGAWTRMVAPTLGSPAIYATLADDPLPDGAFPVHTLLNDYGLTRPTRFEHLYGIAGNPVFRSLSPRLHNAAYRRLDFPGFFVPFHIEDYEMFHREVVQSPLLPSIGFAIEGLTVVSPFKEAGFRMADEVIHPVSGITQSCNLLAKRDNRWIADSTDPLAILQALKRLEVAPRNLRAGVIGCGGAGRAIAATLARAGAKVVLFNRTPGRGQLASCQLNIPFDLLENLVPETFDILVNATPLGKQAHERPFDPDRLSGASVFIDYAYGKHNTLVIESLRDRGIGCVDGREVLIIQVRRQFEVMTGEIMSEELAMRQAFELEPEQQLTDHTKTAHEE